MSVKVTTPMGITDGHPRLSSRCVAGGSMAGLLATRVLADHFEHVTLIERDVLARRRALKGDAGALTMSRDGKIAGVEIETFDKP